MRTISAAAENGKGDFFRGIGRIEILILEFKLENQQQFRVIEILKVERILDLEAS